MPDAAHQKATSVASAHTYVVLLNWNGWRDTIECVASLLQMTAKCYTIVICDNASTDGSYQHILEWLRQEASSYTEAGRFFTEWQTASPAAGSPAARIVLVQTASNLGFAGGCNVGLRYGLERGDGEYFWLLNNDTVVDPMALAAQIDKMESDPQLGITGSTLLFYDEPDVVQCCAGYGFNFWTARVRPAAEVVARNRLPEETAVEEKLRFVSGASMFVRRCFLEKVGLMNEQYFLYFEEIDWTTRAKGLFKLGYCSVSRVFHKEGSSIGSNRDRLKRSAFSERYLSRNRVLFTRTHFPLRLPIVFTWTIFVALSRILRGNLALAKAVFSGAASGIFASRYIPERVGLSTRGAFGNNKKHE